MHGLRDSSMHSSGVRLPFRETQRLYSLRKECPEVTKSITRFQCFMYGKPPTCITNKQYHSFISVLLPFYFIFFLILLEMTFDEVLEELHGKIIHHYYTARLPTVFLHVSSYSLCKLYLYLKMQIKLMLIRLH